MIHFGFPKPITNIQKPYFDDVWVKKKLMQKFDKMLFSILDYEFNDEFYTKKMILNPFNEALPISFKTALKRWIKSIAPKGITVESILLDTHFMYDKVNDMAKLLVVINKTNSTSFLQDDDTSTFIIVSMTHIIKEVHVAWKGLDWESFLNTLLNVKVIPKVVVCLCDKEVLGFFSPSP